MADLVNPPKETANPEAAITKPEESIPENYQGKSFQEVIEMHQNAEKQMGRMSNELGELRKLAESAVRQPEKEPEVDFYDDPAAAVRRLIREELKPLTEESNKQREAQVREKLSQSYPEWEKTVKSDAFQNWVAESEVRVNLFVQANAADWSSANELLGTWEKLNASSKQTEAAAEDAVKRDRKLRAAATEKGGTNIDPRKILNRADLRQLKQNNPSRYNELLPDIRRAYAEGRVR